VDVKGNRRVRNWIWGTRKEKGREERWQKKTNPYNSRQVTQFRKKDEEEEAGHGMLENVSISVYYEKEEWCGRNCEARLL